MCHVCWRSMAICGSFLDRVCCDWKLLGIEICTLHYYIILILGVERNNDDSKRHYFSSNKHDAPGEIIRTECRQEALSQGVWDHPSCVRQKRKYSKVDSEYWMGRIKDVRKRSRVDDSSSSASSPCSSTASSPGSSSTSSPGSSSTSSPVSSSDPSS